MDISCLVALVLVVTSDVLDILATSRTFWFFNNDKSRFSLDDLADLDTDYIKIRFNFDLENLELYGFSTIMSALAIFAFFVPILQVAWILSDGGKRRVASMGLILVLALTGGMCKLIVSLMLLGIRSTAIGWIGSDTFFNLDNWLGEAGDGDGDGDMLGWKVLEVTYTILNGMTLWISAYEWMSIFVIMVILFFTVRAENKYTRETFGMKWAFLGLVIAFLGLLEFVAEILRLRTWLTYMKISFVLSMINSLIFVPTYLIVLGRQLPAIKESFEVWNTDSDEAKPLPLNQDPNNEAGSELN